MEFEVALPRHPDSRQVPTERERSVSDGSTTFIPAPIFKIIPDAYCNLVSKYPVTSSLLNQ
jgi:hypothetical protein